ncbi:hypothetical protein [Rhizobium sp. Leaf306]|uniref:hypothetical protein n=1 Tax=Rhizobium/Agrobacterium group TaxID=227290 RepID=UPI0012E73BEE|nr:hypothetical protein [Rhizobium sp. Leaf306]
MTYITDGYRRAGRRFAWKITPTNLKLGAITSLNERILTFKCQTTAWIRRSSDPETFAEAVVVDSAMHAITEKIHAFKHVAIIAAPPAIVAHRDCRL